MLFTPLPFKVIVVPAPGLNAAIATSSEPPLFTSSERFAVVPRALAVLMMRTVPPLIVTLPLKADGVAALPTVKSPLPPLVTVRSPVPVNCVASSRISVAPAFRLNVPPPVPMMNAFVVALGFTITVPRF